MMSALFSIDPCSLIGSLAHYVGKGRVRSGAQYALLVKNIVSAESSGKRDEATGEATKQIASDLISRDAVTNGMTSVTLKLFGERIGPLLVRAASPAYAAADGLNDGLAMSTFRLLYIGKSLRYL